MPQCFSRPVAVSGWGTALDQMLAATLPDRALARNFIYDHRVPVARERSLAALAAAAADARAFEIAVRAYHENKIRDAHPEFLDPTLNEPNILSWGDLGAHVLNKDVALGRVLDLSGMFRVYDLARRDRKLAFRTLPDGNPLRLHDWLTARLTRPRDEVEDFLDAVFDAMWASHARKAFNPTWVALWNDFESVLDASPTRWLDLTGICPADGPRWIILLQYRVRDVGQLVRPTQLDAGWYAYHFPSPPTATSGVGGHAMDLARDLAPVAPVSEYIHEEIRHSVDHWRDGGYRVGLADARESLSLGESRARHWDLLYRRYVFEPSAWIPRDV